MYYTLTVTITEHNGRENTTDNRIFSKNPEAVRQHWLNDLNTLHNFASVEITISEGSATKK